MIILKTVSYDFMKHSKTFDKKSINKIFTGRDNVDFIFILRTVNMQIGFI